MAQNKLKKDNHLGGENQLPGFPGYRTRPGRTGYDPLDTNREAAFMEGTFYRNALTLRLRTRNMFYLILMFVFGVVPFVPLFFAMIQRVPEILQDIYLGGLQELVLLVLFTFVTGAITINFLLSILEIMKIIPPLRTNKAEPTKERKKKLPKRRKDFR